MVCHQFVEAEGELVVVLNRSPDALDRARAHGYGNVAVFLELHHKRRVRLGTVVVGPAERDRQVVLLVQRRVVGLISSEGVVPLSVRLPEREEEHLLVARSTGVLLQYTPVVCGGVGVGAAQSICVAVIVILSEDCLRQWQPIAADIAFATA